MFSADAIPHVTTLFAITLAHGSVALVLLVLPEMVDKRAIIAFASQINRLARSQHLMMILNRSLAGVFTLGGGWLAFA